MNIQQKYPSGFLYKLNLKKITSKTKALLFNYSSKETLYDWDMLHVPPPYIYPMFSFGNGVFISAIWNTSLPQIGSFTGIYLSTNYGQTWNITIEPHMFPAVIYNGSEVPSPLLVSGYWLGGPHAIITAGLVVAVTHNMGVTWDIKDNALTPRPVADGIKIDRFGGSLGGGNATINGYNWTSDYGETWTHEFRFPVTDYGLVDVCCDGIGRAIISNDIEFLFSGDFGQTWSAINNEFLYPSLSNYWGNNIFTLYGYYDDETQKTSRSTDGGNTWSDVNWGDILLYDIETLPFTGEGIAWGSKEVSQENESKHAYIFYSNDRGESWQQVKDLGIDYDFQMEFGGGLHINYLSISD